MDGVVRTMRYLIEPGQIWGERERRLGGRLIRPCAASLLRRSREMVTAQRRRWLQLAALSRAATPTGSAVYTYRPPGTSG